MTSEEWEEVREYYKRRGIRMTNEEAIKRLNKIKAIYQGMDNKSDVKALDMAIKALEQTDGDLISRQAVINALHHANTSFTVVSKINLRDYLKEIQEIVDNVVIAQEKAINEVPSAENTAECDNNHDCEHCDWTECPLEVETDGESK